MRKLLIHILLFVVCITSIYAAGGNAPLPDKKVKHTMEGWLGLYTKYRLSKKIFYYGEYHFRRRDYFREMANLYLRFGLTYLHSKNLEITTGIVTPVYWSKGDLRGKEGYDDYYMQFRFWEQFLFVMRFNRAKVYHQLRTEQRWARRNFEVGSPYDLTFRFRYKLTTYVPLNHHHLEPGTIFFSGYEEIFMQSGRQIEYNNFEDNRFFLGLGYIINNNLQIQAGYMWTYRMKGSPFNYESRHVPRISFYHNMDFYNKKQNKIRNERSRKILKEEF